MKKFLVTGDKHGNFSNFLYSIQGLYKPKETAIIILGDAGFNFWLNEKDEKTKLFVSSFRYTIYCVRGNHEERPENLGYNLEYDPEVMGEVYIDPIAENIRYFQDGGEYNINGYKVLTIGGAYSVDKEARLRWPAREDGWTSWFASEQLTEQEREKIKEKVKGNFYDFVFTHTCPISCEPTDLFIPSIDQSKVDKIMENWLEDIKNNIIYAVWCFGHYHADRAERPCIEQFYRTYEDIEKLWNRWCLYNPTKQIDDMIYTSPKFEINF